MTEPPYKRSRRDYDSERLPVDSRYSHDKSRGGGRQEDYRNDRNRSYRSRTPERPQDRDRDSQRYDRGSSRRDNRRERDGLRGDGRRDEVRRDDRGRQSQRPTGRDDDRERYKDDREARDYGRSQRDRRRDRDGDGKARSRSPQRDRSHERDPRSEVSRPNVARIVDQDIPLRHASQNPTPPVAFKVGRPDSRGTSKDRAEQSPTQSTEADAKKGTSQKNKPKAAYFIGSDDVDMEENEEDDSIVVEDDAMAAMQAMMGFGGFSTTKQKKVLGNDISGVRKEKKTEYRQYMNRVGGFNRPLSPSRD